MLAIKSKKCYDNNRGKRRLGGMKMKILIVSYVDDNFGDNLIRICFEQLLRVVLRNLGLSENECQIEKMPLKSIDADLVAGADIIFFAGGGLFGMSYLNFFPFLDSITKLADEKGIPVVFSSIGINNMNATADGEQALKTILRRKCIKAVSVRENLDFFKTYAKGCDFRIESVCDPAVWTQYIYHLRATRKTRTIGINVVRGGLFKDNQKDWGMTDELRYLDDLRKRLEADGFSCIFYTNGSVLDNNTLHYFAREYKIPEQNLVYPQTTREVVETVAGFEAVATFRMHSSIIAYAFGIPSVALVWNDKIPFFYDSIGHPERALVFENWDAKIVFEQITAILEAKETEKLDPEYLMSLYNFLYRTLLEQCEKAQDTPAYTFETVAAALAADAKRIEKEDTFDLRVKLEKAEKHYLARFTELRRKDGEIRKYQREIEARKKECDRCREDLRLCREQMQAQKETLQKQKEELDGLNRMLAVRVCRRLKRKTK